MQGDISRNTFEPLNCFSRVIMQQGRVQLDADWNEQVSILFHYLRTLARDIMGPHGTWNPSAFQVELNEAKTDFKVNEAGSYYVNGLLLCGGIGSKDNSISLDTRATYLVYLDVWERHITYVENEDGRNPGIREVALGGPDTATRTQVVWQVKTKTEEESTKLEAFKTDLLRLRDKIGALNAAKKTLNEWKISNSTFSGFDALKSDVQKQIDALVNQLNGKWLEKLNQDYDVLTGPDENVLGSLTKLVEELNDDWRERLSQDVPTLAVSTSYTPANDNKAINDFLIGLNSIVQIKRLELEIEQLRKKIPTSEKAVLDELANSSTARLQAQAGLAITDTDPCTLAPNARYRGMENQLYRVEVHSGGPTGRATFKWSRENGSVIFPIRRMNLSAEKVDNIITDKATLTLEHLGRDDRSTLNKDDWVEVVDDDYTLEGRTEALWQVDRVDRMNLQVILKKSRAVNTPEPWTVDQSSSKHPFLRRWDHQGDSRKNGTDLADGALMITEGNWLALENGIQVQFQPADTSGTTKAKNQTSSSTEYRTGDYWFIPARTLTGDVEWPQSKDSKKPGPSLIKPHGIERHYAPLAILIPGDGGFEVIDCRRLFTPLGNFLGE